MFDLDDHLKCCQDLRAAVLGGSIGRPGLRRHLRAKQDGDRPCMRTGFQRNHQGDGQGYGQEDADGPKHPTPEQQRQEHGQRRIAEPTPHDPGLQDTADHGVDRQVAKCHEQCGPEVGLQQRDQNRRDHHQQGADKGHEIQQEGKYGPENGEVDAENTQPNTDAQCGGQTRQSLDRHVAVDRIEHPAQSRLGLGPQLECHL